MDSRECYESVTARLLEDAKVALAGRGLAYPEDRTHISILPAEEANKKYLHVLVANVPHPSEEDITCQESAGGFTLPVPNEQGTLDYYVIVKYNSLSDKDTSFPENYDTDDPDERFAVLKVFNRLTHEIGGHVWFSEHSRMGKSSQEVIEKFYTRGTALTGSGLEERWAEYAGYRCSEQHPYASEDLLSRLRQSRSVGLEYLGLQLPSVMRRDFGYMRDLFTTKASDEMVLKELRMGMDKLGPMLIELWQWLKRCSKI